MAASPSFVSTPRIGSVSIATADSSYTSPTNFETLITGAANGTKINEIVVKNAATSNAAVVRIFLYDGTNYRLFDEISVTLTTASSTNATSRARMVYDNLILPSSSWSIRVSTSVSQATHVTALGGDL